MEVCNNHDISCSHKTIGEGVLADMDIVFCLVTESLIASILNPSPGSPFGDGIWVSVITASLLDSQYLGTNCLSLDYIEKQLVLFSHLFKSVDSSSGFSIDADQLLAQLGPHVDDNT